MSNKEIFDKIQSDIEFQEYVVMLYKLPPQDREQITDFIEWLYDHREERARRRLKVIK